MASIYYALDVIRSVRLYNRKAETVIMVRYLIGVAYLPFPIARLLYSFFSIDTAHFQLHVFFRCGTR